MTATDTAWAEPVAALRAQTEPEKPTLLILAPGGGRDAARHAARLRRTASRKVNVFFAEFGAELGDDKLIVHGRPGAHVTIEISPGSAEAAGALAALHATRIDLLASAVEDERTGAVLAALALPFDVTVLDLPETGRVPAYAFGAERWIASTRAIAAQLLDVSPSLPVLVAAPPEPHSPAAFEVSHPPLRSGEPLRVLVPDAPSPRVDDGLLREAAALIRERDLPMRLYLLASEAASATFDIGSDHRTVILGRWGDTDLNTLVCALRPHLAWLPYATSPAGRRTLLSDVLDQGLPVLASAIGSLPERLEGRARSWLMPPSTDAVGWLDRLMRLRESQLGEPSDALADPGAPALIPNFYPDQYLAKLLAAARSGD